MIRLSIAAAARADLLEIRRYSAAAFGQKIALAYLTGLRARMKRLQGHPSLGRLESDLGDAIPSIGYQSHRIYYRQTEAALTIVRILHHAQEVRAAFPPA